MKTLFFLQKTGVIPSTPKFFSSCTSCQLGKSKSLPFSDVEHLCTLPLQLVHSDVWLSPVVSNSGFKYYVSFIDDFSRYTWVFQCVLNLR